MGSSEQCIDDETGDGRRTPTWRRAAAWLSLGLMAGLTGCSLTGGGPAAPESPAARPVTAERGGAPTPTPKPADGGTQAAATPLAPPKPARSLDHLRRQAAERLVAANPDGTYMGTPPDVLLAIPVLEIELNANGSIKRIEVLRKPRQALDTVDIAIAAVRRAAPFGDVSALPRPWKFTETFLFNDQRRFKPRTLDT
jgi:hypothetical protein